MAFKQRESASESSSLEKSSVSPSNNDQFN